MWQCPQCGSQVDDQLALCWICGTAPDGTGYPGTAVASRSAVRRGPWRRRSKYLRLLPQILLRREPAVGVPRRFGLDRLLAMMVFFAALFGLMQWLGAERPVFAGFALFFVGVGVAQALLFGGKRPREASLLAGTLLGPLIAGGMVVAGRLQTQPGDPFAAFDVYVAAFVLAVLGCPLGYLAGGLIAGVFLIKDRRD